MNKLIFMPGIVVGFTLIASCEDMWNHCIEGNGRHSTETRTLPVFERIQINGDFKVRVDTGTGCLAVIEADENLQDRIVTNISGDKLVIESKNGDCLNPSDPIEITVTVPFVNSIELYGSGYVFCNDLKVENLTLRVSGSGQIECAQIEAVSAVLDIEGSGNIDCVVDVEDLSSKIEGSGDINIDGSAVNSELQIIGSGHQRAGQLNTDVCTAYISGSGIIDTHVNNTLDVTIIGSGTVNYSGNPVITSHISGSGKIVKQ